MISTAQPKKIKSPKPKSDQHKATDVGTPKVPPKRQAVEHEREVFADWNNAS
jgi:hypothetical protein